MCCEPSIVHFFSTAVAPDALSASIVIRFVDISPLVVQRCGPKNKIGSIFSEDGEMGLYLHRISMYIIKRMNFGKTILYCLAAVWLSACCNCREYQVKYGRPLLDTPWKMIQFDAHSVDCEGFRLVFTKNGRISGIASCNRIFGAYKFIDRNGKIDINSMAMTRIACPDASMERAFVDMLERTTAFQLDGPNLYLFIDGELHAVFEADDDLPMPEENETARLLSHSNESVR